MSKTVKKSEMCTVSPSDLGKGLSFFFRSLKEFVLFHASPNLRCTGQVYAVLLIRLVVVPGILFVHLSASSSFRDVEGR